MFAGMVQQGAVDAWYQVAMEIEEITLSGTSCGGASDIHKFFDQIRRSFVYKVVGNGWYANEGIEHLQEIRRGLAKIKYHCWRIGALIPKGKWDTARVRPWVCMMKGLMLILRLVADGVMIMAVGANIFQTYSHVFKHAHLHLQTMGARGASTKLFGFASCATTRDWLFDTWRPAINAKIEVVRELRYLGARLSTTLTQKHSTIARRWGNLISTLSKLKYVVANAAAKAKAMRTNIFVGESIV